MDPQKADQWWGPRGFTNFTKRKNVQPGGEWIYEMKAADGKIFPNCTKYLEVQNHKKLVYNHGATEGRPAMFQVTVEFSEKSNQTRMDMTMALPSAEAAESTKKYVRQANGDTNWDRLAEFLEFQKSGKEIFVYSRTFNSGISKTFDAWSNPEHIMKWMAPTGFNGEYIKADIRPGGEAFYSMSNGHVTMFGKANYLEIEKNHQIVYTQVFSDKDGKISRHPMAPTWPEVMKTTVSFHEIEPNQTLVSIQWEVFGNATNTEHETFKNSKMGITQGWTGSFDKLEEYLNEN